MGIDFMAVTATPNVANTAEGYVIPQDFTDLILSFGFISSGKGFVKKFLNNHQYFITVSRTGSWSMELLIISGGSLSQKIFSGYIINTLEDFRFLLSQNSFFNSEGN